MPKTKKTPHQTEQNLAEAQSVHESLFVYNSRNSDIGRPSQESSVYLTGEDESSEIQIVSARMVEKLLDECKRLNFLNVKSIVPPTNMIWSSNFPVPSNFKEAFAYGLKADLAISYKHLELIQSVKNKLMPKFANRSNYEHFFKIVLWMEETTEEVITSQYNLKKVTMTPFNNLFGLEVEGLTQKRPSLVKNGVVNMKEHESSDTVYQGLVKKVFDQKILIGDINDEFYKMVAKNPTIQFDISFQLSRITYERMHMGLQNILEKPYLMDALFPVSNTDNYKNVNKFKITSETNMFVKDIFPNEKQIQVIENIVNCTSGRNPYIVFGPPGTGKSTTIVESILQIRKLFVNSTILVCAQSNATCDMLTEKLIPWCTKNELIRVHSLTSSWDGMNKTVQEYSNWKNGKHLRINGCELQSYNIVVITLAMSGWYLQNPSGFQPQYVFIDEAAQASEPEAVVAIALLAKECQVILGGDPHQLRPLVVSKQAKKYGLDVSLLERLMKITDVYGNNNSKCITKLTVNYRTHPNILHLPNQLFYKNELQPISTKVLNDPIASMCIYCKINPSFEKTFAYRKCSVATEFYAIYSEEERDSYSSYFNLEEINMVVKTIKALVLLKETQVDQKDIGVITPYNSQVYKLKRALKTEGFADVEVGSTEVFQGREKRIIIISTVRAKMSPCSLDKRYNLGFVDDPQRFNVALTRAMSKLIVIGCPNVLQCDETCWLKYIDYCLNNNSYFGEPFVRRELFYRH